MKFLKKVRASAADRIALCNASSVKPDIHFDDRNEFSTMGDCGHEIMHRVVTEDLDYLPPLDPYIKKYKIKDEKTLRIACYIGLKVWVESIRNNIDHTSIITEQKLQREIMGEFLLEGHCDLMAMLNDGVTLFVPDWKFGIISEHWNQLKSYAYLGFKLYPQAQSVLIGAYFLREDYREVKRFTREEIENDWLLMFYKALNGTSYTPTYDSCKYCPVIECEARNRLTISTAASLAPIDEDEGIAVALANRYEDVQLLENKIKKYKEMLKTHLSITGEKVDLPSGRVLEVNDAHKRTLYLREAWRTLSSHFGFNEPIPELVHLLEDAIIIKKEVMMEVVGNNAAPGRIGADKRELEEKLMSDGAYTDTQFKKLQITKGEK